jgi:DNA polymerase-1
MRGDPSDNLPGVPGVGEKTAAKLLNAYGDLDGVFAHVEEQTPKLRANLAEHEAQVRQNAEVMRLVRDVPLEVDLEGLVRGDCDTEALRSLLAFLEFGSLEERIAEAFGADVGGAVGGAGREVLEAEPEVAEDEAAAIAAIDALAAGGPAPLAVAAGWTGAEGRSTLVGLALVRDPDMGAVTWVEGRLLAEAGVTAALARLVADGGRPLVAHGAKAVMRRLLDLGVDLRTLAMDTGLAAYLVDPAEGRYVLDELLARFTGATLPTAGAPEGELDFGGDGTDDARDAGRRALAVHRLVDPLRDALEARGMLALHDEVEVPLVRVLARMEHVGVGVDVEVLRSLNEDLVAECDQLTHQIWEDAGGEQFNVNSTPQLREVLFDRLGLTPQKKTKTGYSTDATTLEKLRGEHPIIEHLLRYREVEKLRSTYGEGLLAEVADDGRIHATFNQTVARTGRLSSDAPNLHNIPVRSEDGRRFRTAFVPAEGFDLLVADYNQVELRCIAHLAEDPGLIAAFTAGTDIHTETAARVFGVDHEAVTPAQRAQAKMVSYGLAYGMEAYGLGQRLGIPTGAAQEILDAYFVAFPNVRAYMDATVAEARERGYTETLFGRRRQIPELASPNHRIRQAGERQAMNAGIQGLAADIFKVALVHLDSGLEAGDHRSRLILQVHDEVLVELAPEETDAVTALVVEAMSGAFDLRVPLEVNLATGPSWAAAKG